MIARGIEPSTINTVNFKNEIEFYEKKPGKVSCGSRNYGEWICGRERNSGVDRFFGGGKYENVYCSGTSSCVQEQHSYGEKGVISVNGHLDLGARHIELGLSHTWIKELKLTIPTIAPTIDSAHINRIVTVSANVIGMTGSPHTCESIAKEYGIPGATCIGSTATGHTLTKAIEEISTSFMLRNITGEIEGGMLVNWQKLKGDGQPAEISTALVPIEQFKHMGNVYYVSPRELYDMEKIFKGTSFINFHSGDSFYHMNQEYIQSLLSSQEALSLQVVPLVMSGSFTSMCSGEEEEEEQDQLDCEQFVFLKRLGFEGVVPTQFDFGMWKEIVDTFIYQQTNFHLIKIISRYGSSVNMFREFVANALAEYKRIGAVPGVPLSQYQKSELLDPIVWPVWSGECLTKNEYGNIVFSGINKCISYELYVPTEYIIEQVSGAVFAGKHIDIQVTGDVVIGPGGQLLQMDTEIIRSHTKRLAPGEGGISISEETREITLDEKGNPASLVKVKGNVLNLGGIGGRLHMHIGGKYASGGGKLAFINRGEVLANSIIEVPLEQQGTILDVPKTTLFCTEVEESCVLHHKTTEGNIERTGVETVIYVGDLIIESARDLKEQTIHKSVQVSEFHGDTYISRPEWSTFRPQTVVLDGQMLLHAKGKYLSEGGAYFASGGGAIYGDEETTMTAITSTGEFHSVTEKYGFLSSTKTTVRASSTHTTVIEIETGDPSMPVVIGSEEPESLTTIEGLVSIGGEKGTGIILRGGAGVELLEHLVSEWMEVTTKRSGLLSSHGPRADLSHVRGLKNIESFRYKDPLGFTTGMITDAVAGYKTYDAVKRAKLIRDLPMAGGIAIAAAILEEIVHAGFSFGTEVTVISREGITSIPNIIGKDCRTDECLGESSFGIYSRGDVTLEHTKVKVRTLGGIIAGHLHLKPGTDIESTTVEQARNAMNFGISLSGISVGVSHMDGESEQESSTYHPTEFFAKNVTLVVNQNLNLEGAIIDGEIVHIDAKEITVTDVVNRVKSSSSFVQEGVGVMFNFWTGGFAPQISASTGGSVKESELVQFVSGITGKDVDVTAEKITADLDAITGRVTADERVETQRPTSSKSDESWNVGASFSVGKEGVPNPALSFAYQAGDTRTSATFSSDLLYGLKKIGNWLYERFIGSEPEITRPTNEPEEEIKEEKKAEEKKTANEQPKQKSPDKEPNPEDDQSQEIKTDKEKVVVLTNNVVRAKLNEILANEKLTPEQKAQVIKVAQEDAQNFWFGDEETRTKTYEKYSRLQKQAQDALEAEKEDGLFLKILSIIFGTQKAYAEPGTLTLSAGIGGMYTPSIAISPLAASGIGLLVLGVGGAIALENSHPGTLEKLAPIVAQSQLGLIGQPLALKSVLDYIMSQSTAGDGDDGDDIYSKEKLKRIAEELQKLLLSGQTLTEQLELLEEQNKLIQELYEKAEKEREERNRRREEKIKEFEAETAIEELTGERKKKTFHSEILTGVEQSRTIPQAKAGDHVEATTGDPSSLERSGTFVLDKTKQKTKIKDQAGTTPPAPGFDPDDDHDEEGRKVNPEKAESKIWKELKHYRRDIKTNGLKGSKQEYYKWDHTHNDIEVYNKNGHHLGSKNPVTGEIYKPAIPGRNIIREL